MGGEDINKDANDVVVIGNYAYVANDGNELEVVDVSNPNNPNSIATLNLSGSSDGMTIAGEGNVIFMGRAGGEIESIDVSTPSSPVSLDSIDNGSRIRDIDLGNNGTYIFVASDENSAEFQIIDANDPDNLTTLSTFDAPNDFNGVAYDTDRDRAFLVGENNREELTIYQPQ